MWKYIIVGGLVIMAPLSLILGFSRFDLMIREGGYGDGTESSSPVSGDLGGIQSGKVPDPLRAVFIEAGNSTGVPPAFLAATSEIECGRMWRVPNDVLTKWINSNTDSDERGCNHRNWAGAWGPMQFINTTWGYLSDANPNDHPNPKSNSFGDQAGRRTNHVPAVSVNVRDSIFGAAIKHAGAKKRAEKVTGETGWTDAVIKETARGYCNGGTNPNDIPTPACKVGDLGYGAGILQSYKNLVAQIGN